METIMLLNHIKIAGRHLLRNKTYSVISIFGLALGLTAVFLITLYVHHELSYDTYHENASRIYRILHRHPGQAQAVASTPPILAPTIKQSIPDIEKVIRIDKSSNQNLYIRKGEQLILMNNLFYTEPEFFEIFTFPFIAGDPRTALASPNSIVISQKQADLWFPDENPIGKTLNVKMGPGNQDFQITAVLKDIPQKSFIRPEFILPISHILPDESDPYYDSWSSNNVNTFILTTETATKDRVAEKLQATVHPHLPENYQREYFIQAFNKMHLYSTHVKWGNFVTTGNIVYVYLFSGIAVLILLLACFNYINLSTAQAVARAKEIGVRKVLGANRKTCIKQMLMESYLVTVSAFVLSILFLETALPLMKDLLGWEIEFTFVENWFLLFIMVAILILSGFLSGVYSAFYLASLNPVLVLKDNKITRSNSFFKRASITFQFIIFIALVTSSLVFYKQLTFARNKNLGYDKHHVLAVNIPNNRYNETCRVFRTELMQFPGIEQVSFTSTMPPAFGNWMSAKANAMEGLYDEFYMQNINADEHFQSALQFRVIQGNYFLPEISKHNGNDIVINESARQKFGLQDPIGQIVTIRDKQWRIIGVIEDLHLRSIYEQILPLYISMQPKYFQIAIRISPTDIPETMTTIQKTWKKVFQDEPIEYRFIDEEFDRIYRADARLGALFAGFTLLTIVLAAMGLFGLTLFSVKKRTKEIGIRKVLGGSISRIILMLSREFAVWVLIANILAWPLAYWGLNKWLQNFAYRIDLDWVTFALAGLAALIIALLTTSWLTVKAAKANPVEALRYE